jgi:hypothetical protein
MHYKIDSSKINSTLRDDNSDRMRITCRDYKTAEMQILLHHVYEYKKGLRNLVLHTMNIREKHKTEELLTRKGIDYFMQVLDSGKMNVFFGDSKCVQIIESFGNKALNEFSDEEDFMLGTMLGYDRMQQCERYLKRRKLQLEVLLQRCKPTGIC